MSDVIVIGVAGGTGSGKTTLVKALVNRFGDNISVLSHDNYYKRHDEMSYEERTHLNYDCPDAFDTDMMIDHLRMLKNGQAIDCPTYDYTIHNRAEEVLHIEPRRVIVVEGIMIFVNKTLCDEMNIRIFVDADADVRLCRRIRRDVKKRGRSIDSVIDQYLTTVKPMHELYVEPSKKNASRCCRLHRRDCSGTDRSACSDSDDICRFRGHRRRGSLPQPPRCEAFGR